MSEPERRLTELKLTLPTAAAAVANYVPYTLSGTTLYVSGQLPFRDGKVAFTGKLGADVTIDEGYAAAQLCGLNLLAQVRAACGGDLGRVARVLRLGGFVNSTPDFVETPKCLNGASDLMVAVFGEAGRHARAAVNVVSLPLGAAVEIEAVFELR
jgi:enamine deaminase RidA (YjgF/YER057c/UK114 family)